ncbi:LysR substrate-binding domain-containing protein [Ideonella sp. DXS29W]|uniref:LysR substrate-binding domain-containing protein n=1 Tax=Ideonella lacteola TaxID=2984193 RepID=A0ABU9BW80_9BURK
MRRNLRHLNGLRYFESAARRLSFTEAAAELCVTQGAVSHQIRSLELALGRPLFERAQRQVRLLPAGERLLAELSEPFARIDEVMDQLRRGETSSRTLRLSVTPTFSSRWLIPRMPKFWARHPEVELHLNHDVSRNLRAKVQLDAAVLWYRERPRVSNLVTRLLFGLHLSPVCAPSILRDSHPLKVPSDLQHYPLLHEDSFRDWERWTHLAGIPDLDVHKGQVIDDANAVLMAAAAGHGIALGHLPLIDDDLIAGRLIRPFSLSIPASGAYWLVCSKQVSQLACWRAFSEFLLEEVHLQMSTSGATRPGVGIDGRQDLGNDATR